MTAPASGFRVARAALIAFAAYSALTIWFTWPLALQAGSAVPSDVGDPVLNTWILWWNAFHWPLTPSWWNAPIFFPAHHTMAFSEHLIGLTPIAAPVIWLSGNPLLGYNVSFLLSFTLSATTAFLLVNTLTGRRDAAFLAGLAFGFAPYRVAQWSHLQVLVAFWMPVALIGLHRFIQTGRRRWLCLFFAAFVMQALSNGYYLAFFSILVGLWVLWFARSTAWRRIAAVVAAWIAGLVALLPILLTYRAVHAEYGLTRNLENIRLYSADVAAWLSASSNLWLWSGWPAYGTSEGMLFTGVTAIALIVAGTVVAVTRRARASSVSASLPAGSEFAFYAIAAVVLYLLALGPYPSLFGERLGVFGPYAWLAELPGFASLRAPARLGMLMVLCVSVSAAIAYSRLSHTWSSGRRAIATLVLAGAIGAESLPREIPLWEPPRPWDLSTPGSSGPVLVLPILNELNEAASMYRSMTHGRPLVNGYSGHIPPWYMPLMEALNNRDPVVLVALSRAGVRQIAVTIRNDPDGSWRQWVGTAGRVVRNAPNDAFVLFDLVAPPTQPETGPVIPIAAVHANANADVAPAVLDDRDETWWSTMLPQSGGEELILDLGTPQLIASVELHPARNAFEFPRTLEIEVSADGSTWFAAWRGPTAGFTVGALMQQSVRPRVLVTFEEHRARFVRLRQTGRHRSAAWTLAGVRVFGPSRR